MTRAAVRLPSMNGGAALETVRLVLRSIEIHDAPFVLRLLNEPSFLRFIGDRGVRTLEDATAYVVETRESRRRLGFGLHVVDRKEDGLPVGICGVMRKPWLDLPDLAYAFVPEAWGRGYAVEAAGAALDAARREGTIDSVVAVVTPDNRASIRVLEKLGFRPAGRAVDPRDGGELALYRQEPGPAEEPEPTRG